MTRETKIGLLVGLAFIIVIGILLSDHFASTMQPLQAPLLGAGESVLKGTTTPGAGTASSGNVRIGDVRPDRVVDLSSGRNANSGRADITVGPGTRSNPTEVSQTPTNVLGNSENVLGNSGNVLSGTATSTTANDTTSLQNLLGATTDNTTAGTNATAGNGSELMGLGDHEETTGAPTQLVGVKEYTAEPGDTLGKIAAKALGKNTKTNRDAIIKANPSLQKDPNRIKAGETYYVPSAGIEVTARPSAETSGPAAQANRTSGNELVYTTKSGDSLWKIAVEQVGNPGAIAQIKELNRDVLKNGASLKPNMKLRLPPKAMASAN